PYPDTVRPPAVRRRRTRGDSGNRSGAAPPCRSEKIGTDVAGADDGNVDRTGRLHLEASLTIQRAFEGTASVRRTGVLNRCGSGLTRRFVRLHELSLLLLCEVCWHTTSHHSRAIAAGRHAEVTTKCLDERRLGQISDRACDGRNRALAVPDRCGGKLHPATRQAVHRCIPDERLETLGESRTAHADFRRQALDRPVARRPSLNELKRTHHLRVRRHLRPVRILLGEVLL